MAKDPFRLVTDEFTPSYAADSKAEYLQKVAQGKKRDRHIQVTGGRRKMRYGEASPTLGAPARKRLDEQLPPWEARTQSPEIRAVMKARYLTQDELSRVIQQAIETYQRTEEARGSRRIGFTVPLAPSGLIRAGMPEKAASLLVARAAGRLFRSFVAPQFPRRLFVEKALEGELLFEVEEELPPGEEAGIQFRTTAYIRGAETPSELRSVEIVFRGPRGQLASRMILSPADLTTVRSTSDFYGRLQRELDQLTDRSFPPQTTLTLVLTFQNRRVRIELGEHSKFIQPEAAPFPIDYRTLKNVPLDQLPAVLAKLTGRVRRESTIRRNPAKDGTVSVEELKKLHMLPVPGRPGYVYWWSETKGAIEQTTTSRAATWQRLTKRTKELWAGKKETDSAVIGGQQTMENPMSYFDDDEAYWFEQYKRGQFGAQQSLPVARRNSSVHHRALAAQAMRLYQSGQASSLKQAWAMVKSAQMNPQRSRRNPWYKGTPSVYLPDTTNTGPALVPSQYHHDDGTERRSALVPGPYHAGGIYSNPAEVHMTKNGQPYVIEIVNGRKRARFISKAQAARMNPDEWAHHGHAQGQFGISEALWQGMQPVNRRNPRKKAKKNGKKR